MGTFSRNRLLADMSVRGDGSDRYSGTHVIRWDLQLGDPAGRLSNISRLRSANGGGSPA